MLGAQGGPLALFLTFLSAMATLQLRLLLAVGFSRILLVGIFIWIFMGDLPSTSQNVLRSQVGSTSHQSIRPPLSTRPPLMSALSQPSREFYSHRGECQPATQ